MPEAVIVSAARSPIGRANKGSLKDLRPDELAATIVRTALDKVPHLTSLLERLQVAELLLRLSKDMRLISTTQYAKAIALTDKVGKQANGWRKHSASPAA